jgi:hypothetical protein
VASGFYGRRGKIYAVGYRSTEVFGAPPISKLMDTATQVPVWTRRPRSRNYRRLNFGAVPGYAPISGDRNDPASLRDAFAKRLGRDLPEPDPVRIQQFYAFVRRWCRDNVVPVTVPTFEEWLRDTPYTQARKNELTQVWESLRQEAPSARKSSHVDSFAKLESYPEFKHLRWINSRSDAFKVFCGPAFHAIERVVFDLPFFIKHVPVPDRPALIAALKAAGLYYYENDFTAFESHFRSTFLRNCECYVYEQYLANYPYLAKKITKTISGKNRLSTTAGVNIELEGRRMSGDMCTSLGNGITNLLLALFLCEEIHHQPVKGFVEGDDGLFATAAILTNEDYASLGFTAKIIRHDDPCEAHFCGMTCTPEGDVIKDPRRVFQTFGWTHSYINAQNDIMDSLLRSKALSLCYELPQCPILGQLGRTALELTEGLDADYKETTYRLTPDSFDIPIFSPTDSARLMVEHHYHIPIADQLRAEEAIREHDMDLLASIIPNTALAYTLEEVGPFHSQVFIDRYLEMA